MMLCLLDRTMTMTMITTIPTPTLNLTQPAVSLLMPARHPPHLADSLPQDTAIDASRANTNYCLDGNIINQLNTCLATFSGDDDEDWEETYDDPLEAIGRTCGQIARPGATLTVLISTQVATATPGATNTGILGNPNGDNDDDDDNDNGGNNTTLVSATSTPTTSVTTTVGGPAATTTGSQSNDDNNNNNGGGENTNAGDMVNAGIGGALAVVLVALVM